MRMIETERLFLRRFTLEDLEDFHEYAKDPLVGPPAGWKPHESKEESLEILKSFVSSEDIFAMALKSSGKVIGSLGCHEDRKREYKGGVMIGYVLSSPYWGNGLMSEAVEGLLDYIFLTLGMDLVSAYHYPFNEKSGKVLKKAGLVYEGTIRKCSVLPAGEVVDDVCYSMTREEFFRKRNWL